MLNTKWFDLNIEFENDWAYIFRSIKKKDFDFEMSILNISWSCNSKCLSIYLNIIGFGLLFDFYFK